MFCLENNIDAEHDIVADDMTDMMMLLDCVMMMAITSMLLLLPVLVTFLLALPTFCDGDDDCTDDASCNGYGVLMVIVTGMLTSQMHHPY